MEQHKLERIVEKLEIIVGPEHVLNSYEERYCYSRDATWYKAMPDVVVRPHTTEEVVRIVKLANEEKTPITPRGSGTNLTRWSDSSEGWDGYGHVEDEQDLRNKRNEQNSRS